jgi:protocatechuate 3,4-dioxygenase beta subunit
MTVENSITRRQAVRAVGVAGAAYIAAPPLLSGLLSSPTAQAATAAAKLTPELTEGPYWVNAMLRRADIRANTKTAATSPGAEQTGVPLKLTINVRDASNHREPVNGVAVDIWHANAHGLYSDETSQQAGGATGGQNFLRGYQITGKDAGIHRSAVAGQVSFHTIWPAGTPVERSISTSASASSQPAARRSPATPPRSSSPTPTTTACSPVQPRMTPAHPRRTRPPTRTTPCCRAPTTPPTSSRSKAISSKGSRQPSTSSSTTQR